MTRANYTYGIADGTDEKILWIVDSNLGNMSVTNDMENVLDEIEKKTQLPLNDYKIIYRDSMNNWDGVDYKNGNVNFIFLNAPTLQEAIKKITE
jgi:hypothetical protein